MCAMDTNNEGYCWGENNVGQTGSDTHSPNTYTTSSGSSGPSGGNRSSKCSGHTGSGSGTTALSWTATSYPAKQPIAVVGGQTFTDIIVNGDYVTAKTAAGNSNKAYWWGGESSYTYSKSCSTSACGSNSSGNQWCADWDTTYTYTYVSHPPTGPLYTSSPISGGQFSSLSGDAYTGYFCGVTGSDIYCDTHGPTYGQGQLGNGVTATCSTSCTPSYTTPQIVSTSQVLSPASWLTSGMNIIGLNLGANHACAITDTTTTGSYIGCWGYNASGQIGNNATANRFYPTAVDISTNSDLGTESATTTYDISNFVYL